MKSSGKNVSMRDSLHWIGLWTYLWEIFLTISVDMGSPVYSGWHHSLSLNPELQKKEKASLLMGTTVQTMCDNQSHLSGGLFELSTLSQVVNQKLGAGRL